MAHTGRVKRDVSASLTFDVIDGTEVALLFAVSAAPIEQETLQVTVGDQEVPVEETRDRFGNRMHLLKDLPQGTVRLQYEATGVGRAEPPTVEPTDAASHLRPSRYCEVDEFTKVAAEVVGDRTGIDAVQAVVAWVHQHLDYVPGSSTITDSARTTYVARQGVCRDYAHLTSTLLRAAGVPSRCVAAYAPGLSPMDFHLAVEALVDEEWVVVDATHLAPRESMVRIATGQDAADTAFMTTLAGSVKLTGILVNAVANPELPAEDWEQTDQLR
nr:transglutaminase family protein [Brachybacterium muris]